MDVLDNVNPTIFAADAERIPSTFVGFPFKAREPIDAAEVFEQIRDIRDPEHPHSLEVLGVVRKEQIEVDDEQGKVLVYFTPTISQCSLATLIGLSIKVKLLRSLPSRFKVRVEIAAGTHETEQDINKQLADKERVAAAMENPNLAKMVNICLEGTF
nr:unnamed protein product [Spirometra erinaceieuropaei]